VTGDGNKTRNFGSRKSLVTHVSRCFLVVFLLALGGCASEPTRPATYTVKRGDTLYSIAWKHGVDYQQLARWNGIGRDYVIHPGQVLRLTPGGGTRTATPSPSAKSAAPRQSAPRAPPRSARVPSGPPIKWQWPVDEGRVTLTTRPNGGQGLTVEGKSGQDIRASAAGKVVYTGTGLLGYGQLIIVKHSETYLSAYGHTQSVAVREGDDVKSGQRIATMGAGPQGSPMLYFEIRIDGSPTNPMSLLPQRR
jgi:lipoprotein NlpD